MGVVRLSSTGDIWEDRKKDKSLLHACDSSVGLREIWLNNLILCINRVESENSLQNSKAEDGKTLKHFEHICKSLHVCI